LCESPTGFFKPDESAEKPMSARKIKRLGAGGTERQLIPPKPEITTRAKAGASPKSAAPKRVAPVIAVDAAASPDCKAPARGPAGDGCTVAAPAPAARKASREKEDAARPDFERLSHNLAQLMEQGGRMLAAYFQPSESNEARTNVSHGVADALRSTSRIAGYWLSDPARTVEAQSSLMIKFLGLWAHSLRRMSGEFDDPFVPYDPSDKRFAAPEWRESPFFDFLRQAHSIVSHWAEDLVRRASDVDPHVRDKAKFYLRQISSALSPSNFLATNPELLKETWASSGDNLARGATLLAQDMEAGKGTLKISQCDSSKFELGINMATTPGKVIFRNDLIELIQYAPATDAVFKRPLLIVPPWINKFYILDLNPEKSFVRFVVSQGLTVFMISWVNPDTRHRDKGLEAYMREGIFAALDAIEKATGESKVTAIGYCVGGTLLAMALAYMVEIGDRRIASASFFTTQTDFSEAGDLKIFVDEESLRALEKKMAATGYLDASAMAYAFNMLRPDDLIWSFVVNNYIKGKPPLAFDFLAWNSDSTRMTAANHLEYLRLGYLENRLSKGSAKFGGKTLDLSKITIPVYHLATREDHIAPAKSVFIGAKFLGGKVRFVLAGSGHMAGVINPAGKPKYQYWVGKAPAGEFEDWFAAATEHGGSWWVDWIKWIKRQSRKQVPPRPPGDGHLPPICDAPGEYVRVRY
jgi:polyhydroxyalkanoate synthase subunit PhaC